MNTAVAEIKRLLGKSELTKSDVVNLMIQFRLCIEAGNLNSSYPHLLMYCDWCVHTELDRFGPALQVIESVADVLITTTDAPNTPAFWDDMTAAFMLAQLRSEVIGISSHLGTPNGFCSDRPTWEAFLSVLLEILIDRPLAFPNPLPKRVAPVFKSIQTKWKSKFKNTEGIQKVSLLMGTGDRKNAIFWAVELIPGPTCVPSSAMLTGPLKKP